MDRVRMTLCAELIVVALATLDRGILLRDHDDIEAGIALLTFATRLQEVGA